MKEVAQSTTIVHFMYASTAWWDYAKAEVRAGQGADEAHEMQRISAPSSKECVWRSQEFMMGGFYQKNSFIMQNFLMTFFKVVSIGIGVVLAVIFCHLNTFPGKIFQMTKHTTLIHEKICFIS